MPDESPWGTASQGLVYNGEQAAWAPPSGGLAYNGDEAQWAAAEPQSATVTWNPLAQQFIEPDTTFLMDPDADTAAGLTAGTGALLNGQTPPVLQTNWVAGKYRKGIQPAGSGAKIIALPAVGLLHTAEFTIECWCQLATDWSAISGTQYIWSIGDTNSGTSLRGMLYNVNRLAISYGWYGHGLGNLGSSAIAPGTVPANTWAHVAWTLKNGVLTTYLNGVQVMRDTTNYTNPPPIWTAQGKTEFKIGADYSGSVSTGITISDLRISRLARVPNTALTVTDQSTVTVSATPTGRTIQKLTGLLHHVSTPPAKAADQLQIIQGGVAVIRTDKFINVTPILAGGVPDAAHPTVGHSGLYCYDWQVVDRSLDNIAALGCELYLSIDSVPQLLGGGIAPLSSINFTANGAQQPDVSGTLVLAQSTSGQASTGYFAYGGNLYYYQAGDGTHTFSGCLLVAGTAGLTIPNGATVALGGLNGYAYNSGYNSGPPNNIPNFATMAADLVYHIVTERTISLPYAGLWNEPDGNGFWETTATNIVDYLNLYGAVIPAVKAVSPTTKFGGPDSAKQATWAQHMANYCGTLGAPPAISAATQAAGGTFTGAQTLYLQGVYRNKNGNSAKTVELGPFTPVANGSILVTIPTLSGATTFDLYGATTPGGESGANSLIASGIGLSSANTSFTVTSATLSAGSIPAAAAANSVPFDFFNWHWYSADLKEPDIIAGQLATYAAAAGIATPELLMGEGFWGQVGDVQLWGYTTTGPNPFVNDWAAAWWTAALIRLQANNVKRAIHTNQNVPAAQTSSLVTAAGVPQAAYNAMEAWGKAAGTTELQTTLATDPGVLTSAAKDGTGKVYVILASVHHRKAKTAYPVSIDVSALTPAPGAPVTSYIVDDRHANAYDTGGSSPALQTSSQPAIASGKTSINLRPRAAALLVIG